MPIAGASLGDERNKLKLRGTNEVRRIPFHSLRSARKGESKKKSNILSATNPKTESEKKLFRSINRFSEGIGHARGRRTLLP